MLKKRDQERRQVCDQYKFVRINILSVSLCIFVFIDRNLSKLSTD